MKKKILSIIAVGLLFLYSFAGAEYSPILEMEVARYYGIMPLILNVHMEIGKGVSDNEVLATYMSLLQNMKYYYDLDLMEYLKSSISVSSSIDSFLANVDSLLNNASASIAQLDNKLLLLIQDKKSCDDAKKFADRGFSLALKDFDTVNMDKYLGLSIENENCSSESRINYNVYVKILNQFDFYYKGLKNKYDYFYDYKYDIISSYNLD